ncbi:MAG: type II toxin-antitoxin system VapC family toxin [Actinomycetota bacterium]|nr:type II toxin-antitoxin system VapC family toxin [Actinomycetota bacterium]
MTRGLADTSIFIARESGRPLDVDRMPDEIAVSVVTVGELRAGVLAAANVEARSRRLMTLTEVLALDPVPIDERVAEEWARLRVELRETGQRMPINDSWIAATARSIAVPVVTQDHDYVQIPGLDVILV